MSVDWTDPVMVTDDFKQKLIRKGTPEGRWRLEVWHNGRKVKAAKRKVSLDGPELRVVRDWPTVHVKGGGEIEAFIYDSQGDLACVYSRDVGDASTITFGAPKVILKVT